jgi:hypothetical protein
MKQNKLKLAIGLCIISMRLDGQLLLDNSFTIEQCVQDILIGQNIEFSNITFNGEAPTVINEAVGGFSCEACNLGIPSGFVLSTCGISGLAGPNNIFDYSGFSINTNSGDDSDLLDLSNELGLYPAVYDCVVIEFDFIPLGDSIQLEYAWSSEEYSEWIGTQFNDVFGFFISGPGIAGPYSNNSENIAVVPGTNTPIALGTVNNGNANIGPCTNCEYYNEDNLTSSDMFFMQLDGYTDLLKASRSVQCGESYHMKIALCDVADNLFCSAVFLKSDSFKSSFCNQTTLPGELHDYRELMQVFPNPAQHLLQVVIPSPGSWQIMDSSGQQIQSGWSNTSSFTIDVQNLDYGVYMLSTAFGITRFTKS